jgi:hypothetical protein
MLPDELDTRLRLEARRRRVPVAELVREALEARYGQTSGARRLSFIGLPVDPGYPGAPPDASTRIDELVKEDLLREYQEQTGADR